MTPFHTRKTMNHITIILTLAVMCLTCGGARAGAVFLAGKLDPDGTFLPDKTGSVAQYNVRYSSTTVAADADKVIVRTTETLEGKAAKLPPTIIEDILKDPLEKTEEKLKKLLEVEKGQKLYRHVR